MEAPVPNLVTELTELPCGTLFIAMVGIVHTALTAVIMGKPHLWAGSSLFGVSVHHYLVQHWPLCQAQGSGTAYTTLLTNLRTKFPKT